MLGRRERAREAAKGGGETVVRLGRSKRREPRLRADHELDVRKDVRDQPAVVAERALEAPPPDGEPRIAPGEDEPDEVAERVHDRRVRDAALRLVELPGDEEATGRSDRGRQLAEQRRLPHPGTAGQEQDARPAIVEDARKCIDERAALPLAAVDLLRDREPVGSVTPAEREPQDRPRSLPLLQAALEIVPQAGGGLVAVVGILRE